MIEKYLMKLRARDSINDIEEAALRDSITDMVEHPAHRIVVQAGKPTHFSMLILDGLICRYKDLRDGKRQITALHVPGDFPDLHSFTLKYLDHNVMTMTACTIAKSPHDRIEQLVERFPRLAKLMWFSTNLDACIHREWEVSLGRRSALQRTAHLLCELDVRLAIVGLREPEGYKLPITQSDLAECLGLTPVHVNRVLRELREAGLAEFRGGQVTIFDKEGLRRAGEFDPDYLYLALRKR